MTGTQLTHIRTTLKPTADTLDAARACLDREASVAAEYRGVAASDPQRREALRVLLDELTAERDRLLPYVRGAGRLAGAGRSPDDPARVTHASLSRAIRRVRSRLAPTSGARYQRKPSADLGDSGNRRKAAEQAYRSLRGTLNRAEGQELPGVVARHEDITLGYGRGDGFKGMATYRAETRELIDALNAARLRVRGRLERYELIVAALRRDAVTAAERGRGNAAALHATFLRHEQRLDTLAVRAGEFDAASGTLRAYLYREARRRKAIRRAIRRGKNDWRYGAAVAAVLGFHDRHGRMPTKRECNTLHELPPYTTLQRELGRRPLTQLARIGDGSH